MLTRRLALVVAVLGISACLSQGAVLYSNTSGWQITTSNWAAAHGISAVVDPTSTSDVLVLQLVKTYSTGPDIYGNMSALFLNFTQVGTDATTASKIVIVEEDIQNNTGVDWTDFHWYLVTRGVASFNQEETFAASSGGTDFYLDQFTKYEWATTAGTGVDPMGVVESLSLSGGVVKAGDGFFPGSENADNGGSLVIDVDLSGSSPAYFVLKELPTIPEPATMAILGIGGLGMLIRRKRSR